MTNVMSNKLRCVMCGHWRHPVRLDGLLLRSYVLSSAKSRRGFCSSDSKTTNQNSEPNPVLDVLKDSQIGRSTPLQNPDFNLDGETGEFEAPSIAKVQTPDMMKEREVVDPKTKSVYLFPGQGSQFVGMCKEISKKNEVKDLFEEASSVLGYDLLSLCVNGPMRVLSETKHCQVAVLVASLAEQRWLQIREPTIDKNLVACAGFSLGEITSLVAAGVISFKDAVKLTRARGELMQYACEKNLGGLVTAIGGKSSKFVAMCEQAYSFAETEGARHPVCSIAIHLGPNIKVIGGTDSCLKHLPNLAKEHHIRRLVPLKVSGAFHTELMMPAVKDYQTVLETIDFQNSNNVKCRNVYSNYSGEVFPLKDLRKVRHLMSQQLIAPVKWETLLNRVLKRPQNLDFPQFYELGPGKDLGATLKTMNGKAFKQYHKIDDWIS